MLWRKNAQVSAVVLQQEQVRVRKQTREARREKDKDKSRRSRLKENRRTVHCFC